MSLAPERLAELRSSAEDGWALSAKDAVDLMAEIDRLAPEPEATEEQP